MREEFAEGECRGRKPAGDANSGVRELTDHLAQRRVLAAHLVDVAHPQAFEGNYPRVLTHS